MLLKINLRRVRNFPRLPKNYDAELDDVNSIFLDLCIALEKSGDAEFLASGFGQDPWPVNIDADLCFFLEQLPVAISSARRGHAFEIGLTEQAGIQRAIHFEPQGQDYVARCLSLTEWEPNPPKEPIGRFELITMLTIALQEVLEFLSRSPRLKGHPWIEEWARPAHAQ